MGVQARAEIQGVRDTIRNLNKVEPGLRKEFTAKATAIAAPAVREAQSGYDRLPLSGMARKWRYGSSGRVLFPYTVAKARRGVRVKVQAGRKDTAVIVVQQSNPGAAIYESAGRKTDNRLGRSLGFLAPGRTRVIGPAVYRKRPQVEDEMRRAVLDVMAKTERALR